MKKLIAIAAAVMVALLVAAIPVNEAEAAPLNAGCIRCEGTACSLPYVDDVNEWGKGKVILTVYCCGNAKSYQLKVTNEKGKKAKAVRSKKRNDVWTVVVRKGHVYKLSVRPKGGVWRSIYYGVC